jgi:patatin-like phospholipase/acyl hydrolase
MATYRIISIDGGGIRGLIATIILQRLTSTPGLEDLLESADLVAGTSTGGLLALAIAHNVELPLIRELYIKKGPRIFDDSWLDDVTDLGRFIGAEYDIKPLRRELKRIFGRVELGQLSKQVLITAFDLDNKVPQRRTWKPKLFHNFAGPGSDRQALAVDVGLYTSAAPTYFPSVDGYVDGGVYANNPAMCALAQALDSRYQPTPALDEIQIFSLSTGKVLQYIKQKSVDWGYTQWLKPLVNLVLEGTTSITDYQCRQLLGERYHRVDPEFPPGVNVPLDAVDKTPYMVEFAQAVPLEPTIEWLREVWLGR